MDARDREIFVSSLNYGLNMELADQAATPDNTDVVLKSGSGNRIGAPRSHSEVSALVSDACRAIRAVELR